MHRQVLVSLARGMRRPAVSGPAPSNFRRMSSLADLVGLEPENGVLSPDVLTKCKLGDDQQDLNRFFEISDEDLKKSFPEGVGEDLDIFFKSVKRNVLLVRQPALDVIRDLKCLQDGGDAPQIAVLSSAQVRGKKGSQIDTERGVGKSATLLHAVHWARAQGFLVLHVRSARLVSHGGWWILPSNDPTKGDFDQPQVAKSILQEFLAAHRDLLATLPETLKDTGEASEETTLADLCERGLESDEQATPAVASLRIELAKVTSVPVLVAVDDYNCLFESTDHSYRNAEVPPERLTLVRALRGLEADGSFQAGKAGPGQLGYPPLQRGMILAAETDKYPRDRKRDYKGVGGAGSALRGLGRANGAVKVVEVGKFSPAEFDVCCALFGESGLVKDLDIETKSGMKLKTQLNPKRVAQAALLLQR
eukprot:CAMPEP_0172617642 /NCGR_PEP_ID=MMETSP1068-20121228/70663_1 /TAXON_ID=35684 /ORGANISM="Pseudopedinella elastica, Strain CCMP716" /LENGTH=420 /DNA_ID=CAMNT_0013423445 /DNA_START=38 /DNA_END=1300 /DNA_ORIENTATION=+